MDEISYLAGILDGEGYFCINRTVGRHKRPFVFQPKIGCTMANIKPIALLKEKYGGSIRLVKSKNQRHNNYWQWSCSSNSIKQIYKDMNDILLVKKDQLKTLNDFLFLREEIRNKPINDETYLKSNHFWEKMKELNKRGKTDTVGKH